MLTAAERETTIRFDEQDKIAEIYTASKRVADKLINHGMEPYKTTRRGEDITSWYFRLPSYSVILKPGKSSIRLGVRSMVTGKGIVANSEG